MENIRKLLVVIDPDLKNDFVVERARLIAAAYRPQVQLYINKPEGVGEEGTPPAPSLLGRLFRRQRNLLTRRHHESRLKTIKNEFEALGLDVSTEFSIERQSAESILRRIGEFQPDLVLKSVQHQSALARILITNTDWLLIKSSPVPMLLVKSRHWSSDGSIMAAVDPLHVKAQQSQLDHLLIETATSLAERLKLKTRIFHCYFPDVSSMFPKVLDAQAYIQEKKKLHAEKIEALLQDHGIGMDAVILTRGDLMRTLKLSIRRERTNILVLGALKRNFMERTIVGSTAEKMLYDTSCDVLTVRKPRIETDD